MLVFVLSKLGKPLMPCSPRKARFLLQKNKAKVKSKNPFTIQLLFGSSGYKQKITGGMDTGSKTLGVAATSQSRVLYQAQVELRNDISSKLQQRASYRRTRRSRKTRYRPARFNNRGKEGKLAPSIQSKVESHEREKKLVESILPISQWRVEFASFDIHAISNSQVSKLSGWSYQNGKQKGFYNVKAYILHRDSYQCQHCGIQKDKLHVHHILFRSEGGSDDPTNLITLCEKDHSALHAGQLSHLSEKLNKKVASKTKHATEIGIVKSQLKKRWIDIEETFGFETKFKREKELKLDKSHLNDAIAISLTQETTIRDSNIFYLKKHVNRGDYQQTSGQRSEKKIPTGKLFGLRKFDQIKTPKGIGFIKGKRTSGYFSVYNLDGSKIHDSINIKKNCTRLRARKSTLIEKGSKRLLRGLKARVSAA